MLNEQSALKIGKAFGTFNPGKVVVGNDARLSGPSLKRNLIEGLISAGVEVIDVGMTSTPVLMFSTRFLGCNGGVMVTASHNPKEYNGFKFYREKGIPISYESGLDKIQEIFERENFLQGKGRQKTENIHNSYLSFLIRTIHFKRKPSLRVVVDTGNGSAGILYPDALRRVGLSVFDLFRDPDGNYPNHAPDPSKPENLIALKYKVLESHADIGFAYDGDGDRLVVVGKDGNVVPTGVVFSVLIRNALRNAPGSKVVYTALDSKAIEDVIRRNGGIPVVARVGHTYITLKMLQERASLAGEISGHYYFKETFGADDALFASLKIIEQLVDFDMTWTDYAREYPRYFSAVSEKLRFPIKESEKFEFVEKLKKRFKDKGYRIDTLEGVKVLFDNGWAIFRPSNTEPVLSVSYEAKTKKEFKKIEAFVDEIVSLIPK